MYKYRIELIIILFSSRRVYMYLSLLEITIIIVLMGILGYTYIIQYSIVKSFSVIYIFYM